MKRRNGLVPNRNRASILRLCSGLATKRWTTVAGTLLSVLLCATRVRAELKPGDVLNQSNWQAAKGMMPDAVLRRFELGQHLSKIIELPKEELRWGSRFNEATEKNQGIYEIIADFTWVRPEIEGRGESCIRPAPRPYWAITRIAPTEEDARN